MTNKDDITLTDEERQPCEIWSRVMGYHRPVTEWNRGKRSEFASRKPYVIKEDKPKEV